MHPARKGWRSLVEYEEALVLSQLVLLPVYIYQYIFFSFWNYRFHCCIIICKKVSILWCLRSCWIFGGVEYVINMEINSHVNQFTTWNFCVVTLCLFNLPSRIMSYISRDSLKTLWYQCSASGKAVGKSEISVIPCAQISEAAPSWPKAAKPSNFFL